LLLSEDELLSEAGELLLLSSELEPVLRPPGENEPPVADPGCTPKYK